LRNGLAKVYEPKAPAPSQRLAALRAARQAGLHVFVAMAPTYPDCDTADFEATLRAIADLNPITVFHEPINIRAANVARIQIHAAALGSTIQAGVFASRSAWQRYATGELLTVQMLAQKVGIAARLHSWPDKSLGSTAAASAPGNPAAHLAWIHRCWNRISEWPK
jgi:DNA repair photolyase